MKSDYKTIDELVVRVDERNNDSKITELLGLSIDKCFIKSVANTIGTDISKYKIVRKDDFAVSLMQVSRDSKIPIARQKDFDIAIMSPAYPIFRVKDKNIILPEYLDMWFKRSEFDREAAFIAVGGVRGSMPWNEFAQMRVRVPDIDTQKKIVKNYKVINDRIVFKQKINDNLSAQMRAFASDFSLKSGSVTSKLKEHCTMQYGYTETASVEPIGSKFLRITDIAQTYIDWSTVPYCPINEDNHSKYVLSDGDVVVARTGATVGVAKMVGKHIPDAVFASFLVRIKPILPDYKYYLGLEITSPRFLEYVQNNAGGSAQPQANPPLLGEYEFIIPDQAQISKFNSVVTSYLDSIEQNEMEIAKLTELRGTLITMLSSH